MTDGHPHGDVQQAAEYTHPEPRRQARAGDADFGTGANRGRTGLDELPLKECLM